MFRRAAQQNYVLGRNKILRQSSKRSFGGLPEEVGMSAKEFKEFEHGKIEQSSKSAKLWKNIFFFSGIPILLVGAANTIKVEKEHFAHMEHHPNHYKDLPYLHIRRKPFPWGDGKKSFFYSASAQPEKEE